MSSDDELGRFEEASEPKDYRWQVAHIWITFTEPGFHGQSTWSCDVECFVAAWLGGWWWFTFSTRHTCPVLTIYFSAPIWPKEHVAMRGVRP